MLIGLIKLREGLRLAFRGSALWNKDFLMSFRSPTLGLTFVSFIIVFARSLLAEACPPECYDVTPTSPSRYAFMLLRLNGLRLPDLLPLSEFMLAVPMIFGITTINLL